MNNTYTYGTTPIEVITAALGNEPYPAELVGEDAKALVTAVNQGIDSRLEAVCHGSTFEWVDHKLASGQIIARKLHCSITPADMLVILRRLGESDTEEAMSLRSGILTTLDIEEV